MVSQRDIRQSADKGAKWLSEHQTDSGSWHGINTPNVDGYYKSIWALAHTGYPDEAHVALEYVTGEFLNDKGNLTGREDFGLSDVHHLYPNFYVIRGSAGIDRYDVAELCLRFLSNQQDSEFGGFYSDVTSRRLLDTVSCGAAGLACLARGRLDAAIRAGEFLQHLHEQQRPIGDEFYTTMTAGGDLLRTGFDDKYRWWRSVDANESGQCWYAVGLPFSFIVQLAEATGREQFFDLAESLFDFQQACTSAWSGGSSGKGGWGCAMLYRLTGQHKYRDAALTVGEYLISRQSEDGGWLPQSAENSDELTNLFYDTTAEFTLWQSLIAANLAGHRE